MNVQSGGSEIQVSFIDFREDLRPHAEKDKNGYVETASWRVAARARVSAFPLSPTSFSKTFRAEVASTVNLNMRTTPTLTFDR